jgi:hypothetical protein
MGCCCEHKQAARQNRSGSMRILLLRGEVAARSLRRKSPIYMIFFWTKRRQDEDESRSPTLGSFGFGGHAAGAVRGRSARFSIDRVLNSSSVDDLASGGSAVSQQGDSTSRRWRNPRSADDPDAPGLGLLAPGQSWQHAVVGFRLGCVDGCDYGAIDQSLDCGHSPLFPQRRD